MKTVHVVSPVRQDELIEDLLDINPDIEVKL